MTPAPITQNYVKKYTQKEWDRFDMNMQQRLSNRYTVIITDHKKKEGFFAKDHYLDADGKQKSDSLKTKKEKARIVTSKLTLENLDKGLTKFEGTMKKFDSGMEKAFGKKGADKNSIVWGSKKSKVRF